jgi:hypothetical protein
MSISYDGKAFRSASNSAAGDVGPDTTFQYHQSGDLVWATYTGGAIRFGTLIATADGAGSLDMRYQHLAMDGSFRSGRGRSWPERLPDGRLRLHEHWQWTAGKEGAGVSVVEEITRRSEP